MCVYLYALLTVGLVMQKQFALQQEAFAALVADLHAVVCDVHVLFQVPAVVEDTWTLLTGEVLLLLQLHLLTCTLLLLLPPLA